MYINALKLSASAAHSTLNVYHLQGRSVEKNMHNGAYPKAPTGCPGAAERTPPLPPEPPSLPPASLAFSEGDGRMRGRDRLWLLKVADSGLINRPQVSTRRLLFL